MNKFTIDDKIKLLAGETFWSTYQLGNIKSITMADGPNGLRLQTKSNDNLGLNESKQATCFPTAGCIACSFDKNLVHKMGELLGEECASENVDILLGPAVNIKRSPLGGRNFEYYSEDPHLAGELGKSFVTGLQSKGVGACVKHFAINNQETNRMSVSAEVDERTQREIYLRVFEKIVESNPRAIMSSYNRVNGEYVGESKKLLNDILRKEWGFDGIVISDWYAVSDRVRALEAGLDLEMPGSTITGCKKIRHSLDNNEISVNVIEESFNRIVKEANNFSKRKPVKPYDKDIHHNFAVEIAKNSAVLLKNVNQTLPLKSTDKILFIGKFARIPRFQGGGSSHVNAYKPTSVLDNCKDLAVTYIEEYTLTADLEENINQYQKIVVFAGLDDIEESEGYDRTTINLDSKQNEFIDRITSICSNVIVVLFNGSPVAMPWSDKVAAILEMHLAGEGSGEACYSLLTGLTNPSGRLSESYPICLEHNPSYLNFPGNDKVYYNEGIFVGYRYYTTKNIKTLYPFGYGLSYTQFKYSNLSLAKTNNGINVSFQLTNTGVVEGYEVIQIYVSPLSNSVIRPKTELKSFDKVFLKPNELINLSYTLTPKDFAIYDVDSKSFRVPSGEYMISLNSSSEVIILSETINIDYDLVNRIDINDNTTLALLYNHPATAPIIERILANYSFAAESSAITKEMKYAMVLNAPLRLIRAVSNMDDERYITFVGTLKAAMENYYQKKQGVFNV